MPNFENYTEEFAFLDSYPIQITDEVSYHVVITALKTNFGFNFEEAREVLNLYNQLHCYGQ